MTKMQLGVIFGGRSVEHEVSVVSAIEMIKAADPDRFDVVPFGVTRDGRWLTPDETRRQLDRDDPPFQKRLEADVPRLLERHEIFEQLASVDVLFPLVHGI
ncbi:MAG TPA: D-alanine--D-alanine ligase A, partial [Dehalococcoidia bacterium]|nr:D-alanine--D-alanine ligase A [Dehalococcoidia bacterium]